ncbi:serine-rich adhesin for platelets isoform X2 [Folsomia candida]|uniref:serine-rich adhesin for platelets isoform X2 n=1 Tax=Folsomia candida TaxID=158441 RepID=UPI0016053962|nr:serine-rich adhesin for platelets isoform X2 [Folsomia candida]
MVFLIKKAAIIAVLLTILGFYFMDEMKARKPMFTNPRTPSSHSTITCDCQLITNCISSLKPGETPRFCGYEGIQRKICCDHASESDGDSSSGASGGVNSFLTTAQEQAQAAKFYRNQFLYDNERIRMNGANGNNEGRVSSTTTTTTIRPSTRRPTPKMTTPRLSAKTTTTTTTLSTPTSTIPTTPPTTTTSSVTTSDTEKPKESRLLSPDREESLKNLQQQAGSFLAEYFPEYYNDLVKNLTQFDNVTFIENIPVPNKEKTYNSSSSTNSFNISNFSEERLNETENALKRLFDFDVNLEDLFTTTPSPDVGGGGGGGYNPGDGDVFGEIDFDNVDLDELLKITGLTTSTSASNVNDDNVGTSGYEPENINIGSDVVLPETTTKSQNGPVPLPNEADGSTTSENVFLTNSSTTTIASDSVSNLESTTIAGENISHDAVTSTSTATPISTTTSKSGDDGKSSIFDDTPTTTTSKISEEQDLSSLNQGEIAPLTSTIFPNIQKNNEMASSTISSSTSDILSETTTLGAPENISLNNTDSFINFGNVSDVQNSFEEITTTNTPLSNHSTDLDDSQKFTHQETIPELESTTIPVTSLLSSIDNVTSTKEPIEEFSVTSTEKYVDSEITTRRNFDDASLLENPVTTTSIYMSSNIGSKENPVTTEMSASPKDLVEVTTVPSTKASENLPSFEDVTNPTQVSSSVPTGHSLLHEDIQNDDIHELGNDLGVKVGNEDHDTKPTEKSSTTEFSTTIPSTTFKSASKTTETTTTSEQIISKTEANLDETSTSKMIISNTPFNDYNESDLSFSTIPTVLKETRPTLLISKDDLMTEQNQATTTPAQGHDSEDMISTTQLSPQVGKTEDQLKNEYDSSLNETDALNDEVVKKLEDGEITTTMGHESSSSTTMPSSQEKTTTVTHSILSTSANPAEEITTEIPSTKINPTMTTPKTQIVDKSVSPIMDSTTTQASQFPSSAPELIQESGDLDQISTTIRSSNNEELTTTTPPTVITVSQPTSAATTMKLNDIPQTTVPSFDDAAMTDDNTSPSPINLSSSINEIGSSTSSPTTTTERDEIPTRKTEMETTTVSENYSLNTVPSSTGSSSTEGKIIDGIEPIQDEVTTEGFVKSNTTTSTTTPTSTSITNDIDAIVTTESGETTMRSLKSETSCLTTSSTPNQIHDTSQTTTKTSVDSQSEINEMIPTTTGSSVSEEPNSSAGITEGKITLLDGIEPIQDEVTTEAFVKSDTTTSGSTRTSTSIYDEIDAAINEATTQSLKPENNNGVTTSSTPMQVHDRTQATTAKPHDSEFDKDDDEMKYTTTRSSVSDESSSSSTVAGITEGKTPLVDGPEPIQDEMTTETSVKPDTTTSGRTISTTPTSTSTSDDIDVTPPDDVKETTASMPHDKPSEATSTTTPVTIQDEITTETLVKSDTISSTTTPTSTSIRGIDSTFSDEANEATTFGSMSHHRPSEANPTTISTISDTATQGVSQNDHADLEPVVGTSPQSINLPSSTANSLDFENPELTTTMRILMKESADDSSPQINDDESTTKKPHLVVTTQFTPSEINDEISSTTTMKNYSGKSTPIKDESGEIKDLMTTTFKPSISTSELSPTSETNDFTTTQKSKHINIDDLLGESLEKANEIWDNDDDTKLKSEQVGDDDNNSSSVKPDTSKISGDTELTKLDDKNDVENVTTEMEQATTESSSQHDVTEHVTTTKNITSSNQVTKAPESILSDNVESTTPEKVAENEEQFSKENDTVTTPRLPGLSSDGDETTTIHSDSRDMKSDLGISTTIAFTKEADNMKDQAILSTESSDGDDFTTSNSAIKSDADISTTTAFTMLKIPLEIITTTNPTVLQDDAALPTTTASQTLSDKNIDFLSTTPKMHQVLRNDNVEATTEASTLTKEADNMKDQSILPTESSDGDDVTTINSAIKSDPDISTDTPAATTSKRPKATTISPEEINQTDFEPTTMSQISPDKSTDFSTTISPISQDMHDDNGEVSTENGTKDVPTMVPSTESSVINDATTIGSAREMKSDSVISTTPTTFTTSKKPSAEMTTTNSPHEGEDHVDFTTITPSEKQITPENLQDSVQLSTTIASVPSSESSDFSTSSKIAQISQDDEVTTENGLLTQQPIKFITITTELPDENGDTTTMVNVKKESSSTTATNFVQPSLEVDEIMTTTESSSGKKFSNESSIASSTETPETTTKDEMEHTTALNPKLQSHSEQIETVPTESGETTMRSLTSENSGVATPSQIHDTSQTTVKSSVDSQSEKDDDMMTTTTGSSVSEEPSSTSAGVTEGKIMLADGIEPIQDEMTTETFVKPDTMISGTTPTGTSTSEGIDTTPADDAKETTSISSGPHDKLLEATPTTSTKFPATIQDEMTTETFIKSDTISSTTTPTSTSLRGIDSMFSDDANEATTFTIMSHYKPSEATPTTRTTPATILSDEIEITTENKALLPETIQRENETMTTETTIISTSRNEPTTIISHHSTTNYSNTSTMTHTNGSDTEINRDENFDFTTTESQSNGQNVPIQSSFAGKDEESTTLEIPAERENSKTVKVEGENQTATSEKNDLLTTTTSGSAEIYINTNPAENDFGPQTTTIKSDSDSNGQEIDSTTTKSQLNQNINISDATSQSSIEIKSDNSSTSQPEESSTGESLKSQMDISTEKITTTKKSIEGESTTEFDLGSETTRSTPTKVPKLNTNEIELTTMEPSQNVNLTEFTTINPPINEGLDEVDVNSKFGHPSDQSITTTLVPLYPPEIISTSSERHVTDESFMTTEHPSVTSTAPQYSSTPDYKSDTISNATTTEGSIHDESTTVEEDDLTFTEKSTVSKTDRISISQIRPSQQNKTASTNDDQMRHETDESFMTTEHPSVTSTMSQDSSSPDYKSDGSITNMTTTEGSVHGESTTTTVGEDDLTFTEKSTVSKTGRISISQIRPSQENNTNDDQINKKLSDEIMDKLDHIDVGLNMSTTTESSYTDKYLDNPTSTTSSSILESTTGILANVEPDKSTFTTYPYDKMTTEQTDNMEMSTATSTMSNISNEMMENITNQPSVKPTLPPPFNFILNITEILPEPGPVSEPTSSVNTSEISTSTISSISLIGPSTERIDDLTSTVSSLITMDDSDLRADKMSEYSENKTDTESPPTTILPGLNDLEFVPDYPEQFVEHDWDPEAENLTDQVTTARPFVNTTDKSKSNVTEKARKLAVDAIIMDSTPAGTGQDSGESAVTQHSKVSSTESSHSTTTEISQTTPQTEIYQSTPPESPQTTLAEISTPTESMTTTNSPTTTNPAFVANSTDDPQTIVSFIISVSASRTKSSKSSSFRETTTQNITYALSLNHTEHEPISIHSSSSLNSTTTTSKTLDTSTDNNYEVIFDENTSTSNPPMLLEVTTTVDKEPAMTETTMPEINLQTTNAPTPSTTTEHIETTLSPLQDYTDASTTNKTEEKADEPEELKFDDKIAPITEPTLDFDKNYTENATTHKLETSTITTTDEPLSTISSTKTEKVLPSTEPTLEVNLDNTENTTDIDHTTYKSETLITRVTDEPSSTISSSTTANEPSTTTEKIASKNLTTSDDATDFADLFTSHSKSNPNSSLILDIIMQPSLPTILINSTTSGSTSTPQNNKTEEEISLLISTGRGNRSLTNSEAIDLAKELGSQISNVVDQLLLTTHKNFHLLPLFTECANAKRPRKKSRVLNLEYEHLSHVVRLGAMEPGGLVYSCAGTLISKRYVLTSAQCLQNKFPITTTLIEDELNNKHYVDVESIILHPKFSNQTNHNDIALVRLKEEQVEIKPICLPFEDAYGIWESIHQTPGDTATLSGWTKKHNKKVDMDETTVDIIPEKNCTALLHRISKSSSNSQICTSSPISFPNYFTRGSPLTTVMTRHKLYFQIGVLSNYNDHVQVHERTSTHLPWILDSIEE